MSESKSNELDSTNIRERFLRLIGRRRNPVISNDPNTSERKKELTKSDVTPEETLVQTKGEVAMLAAKLNEPVKLIVNRQIFWFDNHGEETSEPINTERYEGMLQNGQIGALSGKRVDGVNDEIHHIQGVVTGLVKGIDGPIKINNVWFDSDGAIVQEADIERFEETFGPSRD